MKNLNLDIKTKILTFLERKGGSSSEISKEIGHNRITVTKYLEIMRANKLVEFEIIAQAKIWKRLRVSNKKKILVVDDEKHVVELIKLCLKKEYYFIFEAFSGFDALEKIKLELPDLIILDIMMPGLSGYEVCRMVKQDALTQHIPILILSAKDKTEDKLKSFKIGADDYLTKPFDPIELEDRIEILFKNNNDFLIENSNKKMILSNVFKNHKNKYLYLIKIINNKKITLGFKKADLLIKSLNQILAEAISDDKKDQLFRLNKNSFILKTVALLDEEKIKKSFNKLIPFIYSGLEKSKKCNLQIIKIEANKFKNNFKKLEAMIDD